MITKEQCRAARGLLDWTQQDLADAAGMSKTAINNFERGTSDVRAESLHAIRKAFENADIEFIGTYGVHQRSDTVRILKGDDALPALWDDIFMTLRDSGGEVLIANLDEKRTHDMHAKALERHLQRLHDHGISERLLVCEGDTFTVQPQHYYRSVPREIYEAGMSSFIYGDKVALQLWNQSLILIVQSPDASRAEAKRFETLWNTAKPL